MKRECRLCPEVIQRRCQSQDTLCPPVEGETNMTPEQQELAKANWGQEWLDKWKNNK